MRSFPVLSLPGFRQRRRSLLPYAAVLAGVTGSAFAQSTYNAATGNWSAPSTWSLASGTGNASGYPNTLGDVAQRLTASTFTVTQDITSGVTVGSIIEGGAASSNGTYNPGAGGANIIFNNGGAANSAGSTGALALYSSSGNGRLVIGSGAGQIVLADTFNVTTSTADTNVNGSIRLGSTISGNGNVIFSNVNNSLSAGFIALDEGSGSTASSYLGSTTVASGAVDFDKAGTLTTFGAVSNQVTLGSAGSVNASLFSLNASASQTVQNNITVASGNTGALLLGSVNNNVANPANVTTISGTLQLNSNLTLLSTVAGAATSTTNTLLLSNVIAGTGNLTVTGSNSTTAAFVALGVTQLTGLNTFTGTTRIASGSLAIGAASGTNSLALQNSTVDLNAADNGSLVFGTGTATTINSATLGGLKGSRNLSLVNVNTTPAAVTLGIGNNNASTTYSGAMSGAGGIAKIGAGTLTLSGSNSYTGSTVVTAGTLLVDGSVNNSAVSVGSGGVLGGTGRIAPAGAAGLTANSGGAIAPGDGGIGILEVNLGGTTNGASFLSGSTFSFDLNAPGTSDALAFTGVTASSSDVTFNGNTVDFNNLGGLAAGTYTLITFDAADAYTGTLTIGTGLGPLGGSFVYNPNSIQLTVVPEPATCALLALAGATLLTLRRRAIR